MEANEEKRDTKDCHVDDDLTIAADLPNFCSNCSYIPICAFLYTPARNKIGSSTNFCCWGYQ